MQTAFIIPDHVCICLLLLTDPMAPACFLQGGIEGHIYAQLLFRLMSDLKWLKLTLKRAMQLVDCD